MCDYLLENKYLLFQYEWVGLKRWFYKWNIINHFTRGRAKYLWYQHCNLKRIVTLSLYAENHRAILHLNWNKFTINTLNHYEINTLNLHILSSIFLRSNRTKSSWYVTNSCVLYVHLTVVARDTIFDQINFVRCLNMKW